MPRVLRHLERSSITMAVRAISTDLALAAYEDGLDAWRDWLVRAADSSGLEQVWAIPSVIDGWTVSDLCAHVTLAADSLSALVPAGPAETPMSALGYLESYAAGADAIRSKTLAAAGGPGRGVRDVVRVLEDRHAAATAVLQALRVEGVDVVRARRGPIRLADFLAIRSVELAVHAGDLRRSVDPAVVPVAPVVPRTTARVACRLLLGALAERAPGRAVEVRVPPHAAVQCGEGPRHTRGTPPNVVECDAATFLELAAGRTGWTEVLAAHRVSASGSRADLSEWLPLF